MRELTLWGDENFSFFIVSLPYCFAAYCKAMRRSLVPRRYWNALRRDSVEVFADGAVRREVDNRRREVTVTEVDTASRNILNNPVRAFDFLGSEYTPSLVSEADGRAVVRLTPAAGNDSPAGDVTLTVDTATMRPRSLSYDYDGEQVLVNVLEVAPLAGHVWRFDPKNYEGYEFIDFR